MNYRVVIALFILIDFIFLSFYTTQISISYREAKIYFFNDDFLHNIIHFSTYIFGQNDFGLRVIFIFLHFLNLILIYNLSKSILKRDTDRFLSILIYALLPGVNSSALIISEANIIIFLTLLFIYLFFKYRKLSLILLTLLLFIDNSFAILFLSIFFYSFHKGDKLLLFYSLLLFTVSIYVFGFDTGGKPKGFFLDTLGVYSAIFSPFIFIYFFYSIYRVLIKGEKSLLWFIAFTALVFSLILSFRQKLNIADFAPFVVIAIPIMVKVFLSSYRVRIKEFRKQYYYMFLFLIFTLSVNFIVMFYNKPLYDVLYKEKHFAYKFHIAKELALILKSKNIISANFDDKKMALRVKFYGIKEGSEYRISSFAINNSSKKVSIFHTSKISEEFFVTKIHN